MPDALLVFKSQSVSEDYHGDMDYDNFTKWLEEHLFPNLPPNSVVVGDNASYHNKLKNKPPNSSSRVAEIHAWLADKVIIFSHHLSSLYPNMTSFIYNSLKVSVLSYVHFNRFILIHL